MCPPKLLKKTFVVLWFFRKRKTFAFLVSNKWWCHKFFRLLIWFTIKMYVYDVNMCVSYATHYYIDLVAKHQLLWTKSVGAAMQAIYKKTSVKVQLSWYFNFAGTGQKIHHLYYDKGLPFQKKKKRIFRQFFPKFLLYTVLIISSSNLKFCKKIKISDQIWNFQFFHPKN